MKKIALMICLLGVVETQAQIPIIGTIIGKVVKAIDLKVQKMQNQTLWLQNAQKTMENGLHKTKLAEISSWSQKQRDLYMQYYTELNAVKQVIGVSGVIKASISKYKMVTTESQRGYNTAHNSGLFIQADLTKMETYYQSLLAKADNAIDEINLSLSNSSMEDAGRLSLIGNAGYEISQCLADVVKYNNGIYLSIGQRQREKTNIQLFKKLQSLP